MPPLPKGSKFLTDTSRTNSVINVSDFNLFFIVDRILAHSEAKL
jgi:hypothetical protein